jgi:prepilin-type N-terminal cleavage/methylation domain-containing protein
VTRSRGGFTIIEVMVAVLVLALGVLALAGSSGFVSRMLGRGRSSTLAAQAAVDQMERLRAYAQATNPPCTHASFADSPSAQQRQGGRVQLEWRIVANGKLRDVAVTATFNTPRGPRTETIRTRIVCPT